MGKQWLLCKVLGTDTNAADTHMHSSSSSSNKKTTRKRGYNVNGDNYKQTSSSSSFGGGCMSTIFHLFNIQHHHLPFHQPSFIPDSSPEQESPNIILKGMFLSLSPPTKT